VHSVTAECFELRHKRGKLREIHPYTGIDRPQRLQEIGAARIYRQLSHVGGKVVSPTHRSPLPPRENTWYSFMLQTESSPGL
jgi:hypothetical protein